MVSQQLKQQLDHTLNMTKIGMSSLKVLWCSMMRPPLVQTMSVLDLRSCVELKAQAHIHPKIVHRCGTPCDGRDNLILLVSLDDDAVLGQLLLNENHLFDTFNNKITSYAAINEWEFDPASSGTRIVWTLLEPGQFPRRFAVQNAAIRTKHDRHPTNLNSYATHQ